MSLFLKKNLASKKLALFTVAALAISSIAAEASADCSSEKLAAEYLKIQNQAAKCEKDGDLPFCEDVEDYEPEIGMKDSTRVWNCLTQDLMQAAFTNGGPLVSTAFKEWKNYSSAPFRSAHVNRFIEDLSAKSIYVMNFANEKAQSYQKYEEAGVMPEGAILIKYSLVVNGDGGRVDIAPAFVMEKLKHGSRKETGDWRYTMVHPNRKFTKAGFSDAKFSEQLCMECHREYGEKTDSVMFLPDDYRMQY
ncbi:MAG: hypothetical protein HQ483_07945 [Rhodospirillales bacterium]|nr:hypothetical protein [Rhodospirillales bacterium]